MPPKPTQTPDPSLVPSGKKPRRDDHDLNDDADTKISSGTTPINIPDNELFFSFDLFAENSTIGAALDSNVGDDYAESSRNFPVLFEVPQGALHYTHLIRSNDFQALSRT